MQREIRDTYLKQAGARCPYCLSHEIEDCGNLVVHEGGLGWVDIRCRICDSVWFNKYALVGVVEMPMYRHACGACRYLGRKNGHDLYYCAGSREHKVIARFGNAPDETKSGTEFVDTDPELGEAYNRALLHGLVKPLSSIPESKRQPERSRNAA